VIWVAVGGRGTLWGAIIGALLVNGLKSWFTTSFPELWLFVLGSLFIAVTIFLPHGVVGIFDNLKRFHRTANGKAADTTIAAE
jgi:urea transport system permease protein